MRIHCFLTLNPQSIFILFIGRLNPVACGVEHKEMEHLLIVPDNILGSLKGFGSLRWGVEIYKKYCDEYLFFISVTNLHQIFRLRTPFTVKLRFVFQKLNSPFFFFCLVWDVLFNQYIYETPTLSTVMGTCMSIKTSSFIFKTSCGRLGLSDLRTPDCFSVLRVVFWGDWNLHSFFRFPPSSALDLYF